jgi:tetratricopeptide (TPR) repeat protein
VSESTRLQDLQRRVQSDPAPFVFAQLAEEYCNAGRLDEAVISCRTLLTRHPKYCNARLVLGRALTALGRFDEAAAEFEQILAAAPDHPAAMKELAEVYERLDRPADALRCYRRALVLAREDRRLEEAVARLSAGAHPAGSGEPEGVDRPQPGMVDFEDVLVRLGHPNQPVPPLVETLLMHPERLLGPDLAPAASPSVSASARNVSVPTDPLTEIEDTLRRGAAPIALEQRDRMREGPGSSRAMSSAEAATLRRLQQWLAVLSRAGADS